MGILRDFAISPQLCERKARIGMGRCERIGDLVEDALGIGFCDLCLAGECCDACEYAGRCAVPPGGHRDL